MRRTPTLPEIRNRLAKCEAGIVLAFSERAEHPLNMKMYLRMDDGGLAMRHSGMSFSEDYMLQREIVDDEYGRFKDHRQRPFFVARTNTQLLVLRDFDKDPVPRGANRNAEIKIAYFEALKGLCRDGDDGEYGESATADLDCLQRLSFRIHYGDIVAERKLLDNTALFRPLITAKDWVGVENALRNKEVEAKVIQRVGEKCVAYGLSGEVLKVVVDFYTNTVIPLTVAVELEYVRRRRLEKLAQTA